MTGHFNRHGNRRGGDLAFKVFLLICLFGIGSAAPGTRAARALDEPSDWGNELIDDYFPQEDESEVQALPGASNEAKGRTTGGEKNWLCDEAADPDNAADTTFIHCRLLRESFRSNSTPVRADGTIAVAAYNLERGMNLEGQIELFKTHPAFSRADVILISEADRGCERTGRRNVAGEFAKALGMEYAYGVEFIELPRGAASAVNDVDSICEHGNAVLSRFPIKEAKEIRHRATGDWYLPPEKRDGGEPRLGGRMAVMADLDVGGTVLRVVSVHFESGVRDDKIRMEEARQVVDLLKDFTGPAVAGGDANVGMYLMDLQSGGASRLDGTPPVFFKSGFKDAHALLSPSARGTAAVERGFRPLLDVIFYRGLDVVDAGICPPERCDALSDHLPIWARFSISSH